jgi:hypothetical protein
MTVWYDYRAISEQQAQHIKKLEARVKELEASLRELASTEPDRHKESMSYFPPHLEGCIWCHAKRLLNLI